MRRLLSWLNRKLKIVETDPAKNAWYDWADRELDRRGE